MPGEIDGDTESQVAAIESCIAGRAKGILIAPTDTKALVPMVKKARDAGLLVIALDTSFEPIDAADATFATDNFKAGKLIGQWAKATLGDKAKDAQIAFLDLIPAAAVGRRHARPGLHRRLRHRREGQEPTIGDEDDPRISGHDITNGNEEGGRQAMESLLQKDPSINVVYTINEPAAAGAYQALKSLGKDSDTLLVSIDGGCPGVQNVKEGIIGATSMQYPLKMAALGVEAIANFVKTGEKPKKTEGLDFTNTGVDLITDKPVDGVPSKDTDYGTKACWG